MCSLSTLPPAPLTAVVTVERAPVVFGSNKRGCFVTRSPRCLFMRVSVRFPFRGIRPLRFHVLRGGLSLPSCSIVWQIFALAWFIAHARCIHVATIAGFCVPSVHFKNASRASVTAVILFSSMDVAISFIPRGSTLGTSFSRDHSTRSSLLLPILDLAKSSRNLTKALLV